ncbi:MAG: sigma-54 dependent transcriptional regulator [Deltaproteobacteria bacterium]
MLNPNILIVDDESSMRFFLAEAMKKEGYSFATAPSGEEALEIYKKEAFPIAILDIKMPGISGIETFERMKHINPDVIAILITAHGLKDIPMELLNRGIYDYFTKPFDIKELRVVIKRAVERWKLKMEVKELHSSLEEKYSFEGIIGTSRKIKEVFNLMEKVKDVDINILITGESGTGKELAAKTLHYMGARKHGPFVEVGCIAIPDTLLEAELFGYEKGAFTGAHRQKAGRIETADRGTLFLDEVGDLSSSTQTKLLRIIQEKTFTRIGGTMPITVDFRLIAATNKDLVKEVKDGRFREDLYYRLNVVSINLPPLRERKEDIPLLASLFIDKYNISFNKNIKGLSSGAMALFMDYNWSGNIRELENVIQRGMVLTEGETIDADVAARMLSKEAGVEDMETSLRSKTGRITEVAEKEMIKDALVKTRWKKGETAMILNISRKSLYNKMKKYGLLKEA